MTKTQKMMTLIFAVCAAPFVLGTAAYYIIKPDARMNYGQVLPTQPIKMPEGVDETGATISDHQYRGKWWIIHTCGADCASELYATRQARTMLNKEMDRVMRVAIVSAPPSDALKAQHPQVRWIIAPQVAAAFKAPLSEPAIYLADPLGNQVMHWSTTPDIKLVNKDLARLMRASRIG